MSQSYPDILATDDIDLSLDPLKARDDANKSQFSGTSFPSGPTAGQPCWRTDESKLYVYNGSTWKQVYPPDLDVGDAMSFKGVQDCSANPNYPAASAGHTYKVSVAGKIGGASGPNVEVGDLLVCTTDSSAAGNHATVGANWFIQQVNIDGAVTGPASSTNHGLALFSGTSGKVLEDAGATIDGTTIEIGGGVLRVKDQGISYAKMQNISAQYSLLGRSSSGAGSPEEKATSANVWTFLGQSSFANMRSVMGVAIGSDVQAYSSVLTTWSGINPSANVQSLNAAADYAAFKTLLSLNNVENKSSATIRGELTSLNVTGALTYTPMNKAGDTVTGDVDFQQLFKLSGDISPTQIAANTNDYAPTGYATAAIYRINTDASRNITGLAGGADGTFKFLLNNGSFNFVLKNADTGSTAGNRFALNADLTIVPGAGVLLWYDSTSSRWRALYQPPAGGTGLTSGDIGATVQAWAAKLDAIAAMTWAADKGFYTTSSSAITTFDLTSTARSLLDDTSIGAMATTLGLGTGDSPQFTAVNIGNASDTTVTRVSAGVIAVEGKTVGMLTQSSQVWTARNIFELSGGGETLTVRTPIGGGGIPQLLINSHNGGGNFGGYLTFSDDGASGSAIDLQSIANGTEFRLNMASGNGFRFLTTGGGFYPTYDNGWNLGGGSNRWGNIYAGNGSIITSDQNEKTPLEPLSPELLKLADLVFTRVGVYQFLDAVAKKGPDAARLHIGLTAQWVLACCEKVGIDAYRHGFVGRDAKEEEVEIEEQVGHTWVPETTVVTRSEIVVEYDPETGLSTQKKVAVDVEEPVMIEVTRVDENGAPVPMALPFGPVVPARDRVQAMLRVPNMQRRTERRPVLDDKGEPVYRLSLRYDQLTNLALGSIMGRLSTLEDTVARLERGLSGK